MRNCIKRPFGTNEKHEDQLFNDWVKENEIKKEVYNEWFYVFRGIRAYYPHQGSLPEYRTGKTSIYGEMTFGYNEHPPQDDHGSLWEKKDGNRIYVYHSYNFIEEQNKEVLLEWAEKHNLTVSLQGREKSWYYPGSTYMISLMPKPFYCKYGISTLEG